MYSYWNRSVGSGQEFSAIPSGKILKNILLKTSQYLLISLAKRNINSSPKLSTPSLGVINNIGPSTFALNSISTLPISDPNSNSTSTSPVRSKKSEIAISIGWSWLILKSAKSMIVLGHSISDIPRLSWTSIGISK